MAVIGDGLWRRSFGSDPSVLGHGVRINNQTFTIVGVAARGFIGTDIGRPTDVWIPMAMQREVGRDLLTDARTNWLEIIGRLKAGVGPERAGAALTAYLERRAGDTPAQGSAQHPTQRRRLILLPGDKGSSTDRHELGPALRALLALTGLALVLTCVNVASLLVGRAVARERGIAVRLALGADRSNLVRQFFTETLVLAAIGGTAGLLIAPWLAGLLVASQPDRLAIDASLDVRVVLFGLATGLLTGLLVGLAPVLASRKIGIAQVAGNQPGTTDGRGRRLNVRDLIVMSQLSMSLVMLIGASLFVQSLRGLSSIEPGFRADDLLLITMDPDSAGYEPPRLHRFWQDTLERVSRVRGVQSASLANIVPLAPDRQRQPVFHPPSGQPIEIDTLFVGPRYFQTLGIPLRRGRDFGDQDVASSGRVVVVNERMARTFWPNQDPVGKSVPVGPPGSPPATIVGIVNDVKYRDLRDDAKPILYFPILQTSSSDAMTLHVRASGDPGTLAATIRGEIQALDGALPLYEIRTSKNSWTDRSPIHGKPR